MRTRSAETLIETPEGNLSPGMRQLNGVYTQRFNLRHGRVGHVFQGRFKAIVVDRDSYLLELCRYVVLNPLRTGMVKQVERYAWSSYPATMGLAECPAWLETDWVLGHKPKHMPWPGGATLCLWHKAGGFHPRGLR